MQELKITSIEDLKKVSQGSIVRFPDFADGQQFVARVKRPSLLKLMRDGKIPNSLAQKANELFVGKAAFKQEDDKALSDLFKVLDIFADACLVEPSMQDLKECGVELTDEQLLAVFQYAQRGMEALEKFRVKQTDSVPSEHVENVQQDTVRDDTH